jgi:hypothetical protein
MNHYDIAENLYPRSTLFFLQFSAYLDLILNRLHWLLELEDYQENQLG